MLQCEVYYRSEHTVSRP